MASSARARFGELERAVLDVLWTRPPEEWLTVRQVHDLLARDRDLAYTTAMTVLDRMAKKGLLDRQKEGRAYSYRAHTSRADMTAGLMRETLEEVAAEDRAHALVAFVGEADPDEIAALRHALAAIDG
jgi:predicted transcriptional regulator